MKLNKIILKTINEGVHKSLISFDDIQFGESTSSAANQKIQHTIEDWKTYPNFVDLDLPSGLLWSKYNLGAESEENIAEYGNYYAWGDVKNRIGFDPDDVYPGRYAQQMESQYDAANKVNQKWYTPTYENFLELFSNTDHEWTTINDKYNTNGHIFYSKKDKSKFIFFPAAGYISYKWELPGDAAILWSATSCDQTSSRVIILSKSEMYLSKVLDKWYGCSVRPVRKKEE